MTYELWDQLAAKAGRALTAEQHASLERYLVLLSYANTRMNLTRIVDRDAAAVAHIGDAFTLMPFIPAGTLRMADVGSGGGVPGIPLAIAYPEVSMTLIESTQKKAVFLQETALALGLTNVTVLPIRAEEAGRGPLRDACDVVIARAVGELVFLVEWCLPLARKGGKLLTMKGAKAQEEMVVAQAAIHLLSGAKPVMHPVELPGTQNHVIVEIAKIGRTDDRFPRPATQAKGKPVK